jgi:hypothetical protein
VLVLPPDNVDGLVPETELVLALDAAEKVIKSRLGGDAAVSRAALETRATELRKIFGGIRRRANYLSLSEVLRITVDTWRMRNEAYAGASGGTPKGARGVNLGGHDMSGVDLSRLPLISANLESANRADSARGTHAVQVGSADGARP